MEKKEVARPDWAKLFESILTEPGRLGDYYNAFHNYSLGNQALAMDQMHERRIPISPIASFNAWKEKGRSVMKGQRAIALWMPVTIKGKPAEGEAPASAKETREEGKPDKRIFVMRNNWFAFAQTQPDPHSDVPCESLPPAPKFVWNKVLALETLGITERPFSHVNGNCQGLAWTQKQQIAINPMAGMPHKTVFHELAHCLLHAGKDDEDEVACASELSKDLKEAEAESTAFLCCAALGLPGLQEARGYVQSWLSSKSSREAFQKSAGRVFRAADRILKAGIVEQEQSDPDEASSTQLPETEAVLEGQGMLFA